jgi:iron complex transport system substrate-binding protein
MIVKRKIEYLMRITSVIFILFFFVSCREVQSIRVENEYSVLFDVKKKGDTTTVTTVDEFGTMLSAISYEVPYKRVVLLNTTYLSYVKALNKKDCVVGVVDKEKIASFYFDEHSEEDEVKNVGKNSVLNLELITALKPDLIICNSFQEKDLGPFSDVDVLIVNEFWEKHPLGRAEWVKVFGGLFGVQEESADLFSEVKANYERRFVADMDTLSLPQVYNLSRFSSSYFLPGCQSLISKMIIDAHGNVKCVESTSKSVEVSQEQQLLMCGSVDYLLFIDWLPDQRNKEEVLSELAIQSCFSGEVIYCNAKSCNYFEASIMEPDVVVYNLFQILHLNKKQTKYFTLLKR